MKLKKIKEITLEFILWFIFFSGFINIAKMINSYTQNTYTLDLILQFMLNIRLEILTITIAAGFLLLVTSKWH